MFGRNKRNKTDFIATVTASRTVLSVTDNRQGLDFLVSFFSAVRPSSQPGKRDAAKNLQSITVSLHQHPVLLTNLRHALFSQLIRTDLSATLTESGIPLARGFWQEFFGRIRHKLLPPLRNENDFLYVLNRVFFRSSDYQWVESIPRESWILFFESIGLSLHVDDSRLLPTPPVPEDPRLPGLTAGAGKRSLELYFPRATGRQSLPSAELPDPRTGASAPACGHPSGQCTLPR